MKDLELVFLRWIDSHQVAGWQSDDDWDVQFTTFEMRCESVGWIYREDDEKVLLVRDRSDESMGAGIFIPKIAITQRLAMPKPPRRTEAS
jgi:hypothetical protein